MSAPVGSDAIRAHDGERAERGPRRSPSRVSEGSSADLLREIVAHLRRRRTDLRREWARRITEAKLLTAMTREEIFAEATSIYDNYVEALETGTFEALQAYASNLSARIIPRGVETHEVVGIVLLLRDVLARSLFARYRAGFTKLSRILDAYEPAANRIANTVAVGFVQERERVIRQQQEAIRALATLQLSQTLEQEIQRIAHAVHDEAGQLVVAARLSMSGLAEDAAPSLGGRLGEVCAILDRMEEELRRLSHELRPTVLDDLGLVPAIESLCEGMGKRWGVSVQVESTLQGRCPPNVETTAYRIVQEALANVAKHSRAAAAKVQLGREANQLCCTIRDDGVGFDTAAVLTGGARRGLGLLGMRERVHSLGGTLQIDSLPDRGTELRFTIPAEP
jgi:signal transduction histidine kinase